MPGKALVVDANILVRAVLGTRVREVIERYAEAEEYLPMLVLKRGALPKRLLRFCVLCTVLWS
jgi:hypothetical protein